MPCRQVVYQKISADSEKKKHWPFTKDSMYFTQNNDTVSVLFFTDSTITENTHVAKTDGNPDCKPDSLSYEKASRIYAGVLPFTTQFDLYHKRVSILINQHTHNFPIHRLNSLDSLAFVSERWNNHDFDFIYLSVIGTDSVYYNNQYGLIRFASPTMSITLKP